MEDTVFTCEHDRVISTNKLDSSIHIRVQLANGMLNKVERVR